MESGWEEESQPEFRQYGPILNKSSGSVRNVVMMERANGEADTTHIPHIDGNTASGRQASNTTEGDPEASEHSQELRNLG